MWDVSLVISPNGSAESVVQHRQQASLRQAGLKRAADGQRA